MNFCFRSPIYHEIFADFANILFVSTKKDGGKLESGAASCGSQPPESTVIATFENRLYRYQYLKCALCASRSSEAVYGADTNYISGVITYIQSNINKEIFKYLFLLTIFISNIFYKIEK